MKHLLLTAALLLTGLSAATAQTTLRPFEFGIKGGATFTHGYTTVPTQSVTAVTGTVSIPQLQNDNNGIGYGYSGGIWARKNFQTFFIQVEGTYNRYVLNQRTNTTLDVNANASLANALPVSVAPGLLNATLNVTSTSTLESINVPVLFGKRWMDGRLRGYIGPDFIFVRKATLDRNTSGVINGSTALSFPQTDIPLTAGSTNLLNKYEAGYLEVKDFTYAAEIGIGYTPIPFLDIDIRYAVPVGGVYKDANIKGFLGIATATIGLRIF